MKSDIQEKEKDENRKQSDKKMCSFGSITQKKMYTLSEGGTCGDGVFNTSEKFLEILCFRHFARHVEFPRTRKNGRKKQVVDSIEVSVILHMV